MKTILIWNDLGAEISYFLIENPTKEEQKVLDVVSGKYMNIVYAELCDKEQKELFDCLVKVSEAIYPELQEVVNEDWESIWSDYKIDISKMVFSGEFRVIECGFHP